MIALPGLPLPPVLSRIYLQKPPTDEPTAVSRTKWKFWFSRITFPRGESGVALLRVWPLYIKVDYLRPCPILPPRFAPLDSLMAAVKLTAIMLPHARPDKSFHQL